MSQFIIWLLVIWVIVGIFAIIRNTQTLLELQEKGEMKQVTFSNLVISSIPLLFLGPVYFVVLFTFKK